MSISITMLGHAPKNSARNAGSTSGGGGAAKYLHLAWANSENGRGFTKSNINSEGHIVPYKYLGICMSDDLDDDMLSFGNYAWTHLCPCGGSGESSSDWYDYCDPADPLGECYDPTKDPYALIDPQTVEYVKPACIDNSEHHTATQPYHLLFADELSTIGYSLTFPDGENEATSPFVTWGFELKCQQVPIEVKTAYDYYDGWVFYADLWHGWTAGIDYVFTRLDDYLTAESGYTRANDGRWHRAVFETDPTLTFDNGQSTVPTALKTAEDNGAVSGTSYVGRCIAEWNISVIDSIYGQQKTMQLHECRVTSTSYDQSARLYNYSVYDSVIKYRWKATSFAALLAQLPKSYEIAYGDLMRHVDFYCSGETREKTGAVYNDPTVNIGGGEDQLAKTYYVSTKQGAYVTYNQPTYSGWQSDYEVTTDLGGNTIYVRYYNGYGSNWFHNT